MMYISAYRQLIGIWISAKQKLFTPSEKHDRIDLGRIIFDTVNTDGTKRRLYIGRFWELYGSFAVINVTGNGEKHQMNVKIEE